MRQADDGVCHLLAAPIGRQHCKLMGSATWPSANVLNMNFIALIFLEKGNYVSKFSHGKTDMLGAPLVIV